MNDIRRAGGFTLAEVVVAASVAVALLGFVLTIHGLGTRGFSRTNWHSSINRQGNVAGAYLVEILESASAPSVVRADGTAVASNVDAVKLPSGQLVSAGGTEKVLLTAPVSSTCIPPGSGVTIWTDILLTPQANGLGALYSRQSRAEYGAGNFSSVTNPGNGPKKLLMNDVKSVSLTLEVQQGLIIDVVAAFPPDQRLTQKFTVTARSNLPVKID